MHEVPIDKALSRRFPERLFLLTSIDKDGKPNIMTIGWCMLTSFEPFMVAISVCKERYTNSLIKQSKEFVLSYPSVEMEDIVLYCGTHSGLNVDKLKELNLKTNQAKKVRPPLIEKCEVSLECKVTNQIETGSNTLFIGEILAAHTTDKKKNGLYCFGADRYGGTKLSLYKS